ncbi:MAG: hypothetical protein M9931_10345 [Chitinophagales bacterium]|nr:hypothetical protein [Chitinophagales bacterium]
MLRTILGIVIGLACGVLIISGWESFIHTMFQLPNDVNLSDKVAAAAAMQQVSTVAYILILLGYALAAFVGGAAATAIDKSKKVLPALTVAGLLMIAVADFVMLPHPTWFIISTLIAYPLFALIAAALILKVKLEA